MKQFYTLLTAFILSGLTTISAAEYCHTSITSNRGNTAYVTMRSLGGDQYEFKFETEQDIVSWNAGGSNFYAEINGAGGYQVSNHLTQVDAKTLSVTLTSTPKPNIYVGTFYVNFADGEHMFSIPTDEDFSAVCTSSDTTAPDMVAASVSGTPGFSSVVLQLSATDDVTSHVSQFVINDATNGITNKTITADATGKATVTGLSASTSYNFTINAKDGAGNISANSVTVAFTTSENTNTACAGISTEASEGTFTAGYSYKFETNGTDVTVTFELLDTKAGLVAYLWNKTSGFAETGMTNSSGQIYATTLTEQTTGTDITVAVKFAFAGGLCVTRDFVYTVGETCSIETSTVQLTKPSVSVYPNPVKDYVTVTCDEEMTQLSIKNLLGQNVKTETVNQQNKTVNVSDFPAGNYLISVKTISGKVLTQKIVIE